MFCSPGIFILQVQLMLFACTTWRPQVPAAPHHPPKPLLSSNDPWPSSPSSRWNTLRSRSWILRQASSKKANDPMFRRSSVQLIEAETETNDVNQHSRLVTRLCRCHQAFVSLPIRKPPRHISVITRGKSTVWSRKRRVQIPS